METATLERLGHPWKSAKIDGWKGSIGQPLRRWGLLTGSFGGIGTKSENKEIIRIRELHWYPLILMDLDIFVQYFEESSKFQSSREQNFYTWQIGLYIQPWSAKFSSNFQTHPMDQAHAANVEQTGRLRSVSWKILQPWKIDGAFTPSCRVSLTRPAIFLGKAIEPLERLPRLLRCLLLLLQQASMDLLENVYPVDQSRREMKD